jgi:hypothetical protein
VAVSLTVEEIGVPGENLLQVIDKLYYIIMIAVRTLVVIGTD